MNPVLLAADIQARCARMQCRVAAMQAENAERIANGRALAYGPAAFESLVDDYGLGINEVHAMLHEAT